MFYDNELLFLQKMLSKCHLPNQVIDPEAVLDEKIDRGLGRLFRDRRLDSTFFDFFPEIKENTVYRVTDLFLCRYVFFLLPFCEQKQVFFIGPYLSAPLTEQQVMEQGERMGLPPRMAKDLELYYTFLTVMREETHLFAMVNTFAEYIWGGEGHYDSVDISRDQHAAFLPAGLEMKAQPDNNALSMHVMENRYNYENELMEAVAKGNAHKAELMMASFSVLSFESRTTDPLRNAKNYCVIMNTLMRKAAERGGVHPVHLDRISSDFARRIEALQLLPTVVDFMLEMMRTYCRLVRRHSIKHYSPLIQKVIIQIENDLTCDLSLQTVARQNSVSPGYLSGHFKKETGQTFTAYVNNRRVNLAKHLLRTTNLQVQTIAQHCGILDFHYFCRVFKSCVGKTPTEYRNGYGFD